MKQKSNVTLKLTIHEQTFSGDDVIISNEYLDLHVGDVLEVYHPDGRFSRLLVEVKQLNSSGASPMKGSVSIQSSLASAFQLRQFNDVIVNKVNKNDVTLDRLELVVKDHFVTRSDAWYLHQSLIGSCVYYSKKCSFCNMRIHVNEMWMKEDLVACGVVGERTRVIYRSQSAKFHIFVQMSCEMWNFDFSGDLYFEKSIMGFLQDLFNKWKGKDVNCNHQVVIVLFSRTYYDAQSLDEFSEEMQREVLRARDGRFYKDFYKIIRQSEKQDNLQNVILDLKRSFNGYPLHVGCRQPFEEKDSSVSPKGLGRNSRASEGNLLEAINLSLNVFEKNYIDCNLEETNCTTLIITPSTGVFEVDEELVVLTESRLTENGVGVDLVCLAEQPLHAVPLFKYYVERKPDSSSSNPEVSTSPHIIPQWVNLSYYSKSHRKSAVFIPRMQVPQPPPGHVSKLHRTAAVYPTVTDYDEFDDRIFNYMKRRNKAPSMVQRLSVHRNITLDSTSANSSPEVCRSTTHLAVKKLSLQESNVLRLQRSISAEPEKIVKHESYDDLKGNTEREETPPGSSELLQIQHGEYEFTAARCHRINPFKPHSMANKLTLFKQRWLHAFPTDVKGLTVQEHQKVVTDEVLPPAKSPAPEVEEAALATVEARKIKLGSESEGSASDLSSSANDSTLVDSGEQKSGASSFSNPMSTVRDISVEKVSSTESLDWTASIMTGVDWKSLCMPASLPLTISHFPDEPSLKKFYSENHYNLVIEDAITIQDKEKKDCVQFDRSSLPPEKKFMEMISQRLAQGFQFVTNPEIIRILKLAPSDVHSMQFNATRDYVMSQGLTIHHLKLDGSEIKMSRYCLREPLNPKPMTYKYNVWPHNCLKYSISVTEFHFESADKYNWNNLDRYICETERENSQLNEQMKYWRARFLLLPVRNTPISSEPQENNGMRQIEGFLRFLEGINKIRRSSEQRPIFQTRSKLSYRKSSTTSSQLKADRRSVTPERTKEKKSSFSDKSSPVPISNFGEGGKDEDNSRQGECDMFEILRISKTAMCCCGTPRSASVPNSSVPDDMPPEHSLSIHSPLCDIVKVMTNPKYGLHFLPKQDNLRENSFISAEAVAWMIKCIDECNTKADAVELGQRLLTARHIIHASESSCQNFVDGFFLYFIKEEKKEDDSEKRRFWFGARKTEEELLTSYNIEWVEVAVWRDEHETAQFLFEELPPDILDKKVVETDNVPVFKSMEYNLDTSQKRHRSEWCNIVYHGNYYPFKCAYMIELDWIVSSGSVIAELVQKWGQKARGQGLHLVPAPMCAFPTSSIRCIRNPLRRSAFIHLNVDCLLKDGQKHLFEDYDPKSWSQRMILFQEAILFKFDFVRDVPQASATFHQHKERRKYNYIHTSGSLLVQINDTILLKNDASGPTENENDKESSPFLNFRRPKKCMESSEEQFQINAEYAESYGFLWVYNYALSSKYRNKYTGDVLSAKKFMTSTFSDFCVNKDDQLIDFWKDSLFIKDQLNEEADK